MPRTAKHLLQIQLSDDERRRLKSLAARQGMTFRQAALAAFEAWEEKLSHPAPPASQPRTTPESKPTNWLQRAAKLDWTKCPEVEILAGKDRRLWVLRGTLASLAEVLQSVNAGNPVAEIAEVYQLELPQLTKVLEFAGAATIEGGR
jgi:hypothetical protein